MEHQLRVTRRIIWVPNNDNMIALGVRADTIKIIFDEEWSKMDWIVVHFSNKFKHHRAILEGDTVTVPWEVLLDPGVLYVTFVGYIGLDVRLTTEQMSRPYFINPSGPVLLESPLGSSPDDMQYFLSIARDCEDAEEVRRKSEEQRRINELVRIENEKRRKWADDVLQKKLGLISKAIHTLGAQHSDIPYLYLVGAIFDNNEGDGYEPETSSFVLSGSVGENGIFELGGELVGCA